MYTIMYAVTEGDIFSPHLQYYSPEGKMPNALVLCGELF